MGKAWMSPWTRLGAVALAGSIGILLPAGALDFSPGQQVVASAATVSVSTVSPLGVMGGEDPGTEQALAQSMGRQPGYAMAFLDGSSFQKMEDPSWFISQFQGSGYSMIWGVPILPSSGDNSLATGATGAYNQYFVTLAQGLVAGGQGSSIIRLGWEFNGSWFPWAATGQAANFIAYWRQIVTAMRSVPRANFKFEWNPTSGDQGAGNLADYYPGNSYVDLIGLDVYDISWGSYPGAAAEFTTLETEPYGLNWLASFAAQQGKPMTLPEWGLGWGASDNGAPVSDPGTETSGGDDPTFINDMAGWITANNVYEATMWDVSTSLVSPTSNPNSFAAVVHDFGTSSPSPAPPIASTSTRPTPAATETPTTTPVTTTTTPTTTPVTTTATPTSSPSSGSSQTQERYQLWRKMGSLWSFPKILHTLLMTYAA